MAHSTAQALLARARADPDGEVVDRLVSFTDEHGIDDIAELGRARRPVAAGCAVAAVPDPAHDPRRPAHRRAAVRAGEGGDLSVDPVVAGAPTPAGPDELVDLVDTILRGLFQGDFAVALDRAAAFCRVQASGASHLADDYEATEPDRASALTTRALRLADYATDLAGVRRALAPRVADLTAAEAAAPQESGRRTPVDAWMQSRRESRSGGRAQ